MAKQQGTVNLGKVIVYGSPSYQYDGENKSWSLNSGGDEMTTVDILNIQEIQKDRIITSKYVLPLCDAIRSTSSNGVVYSYHASLPYLQETAHLAEVEKNTIISQAFLYAGRNRNDHKTSPLIYIAFAALGLLAMIGMFK